MSGGVSSQSSKCVQRKRNEKMLTKTELCEAILEEFKNSQGLEADESTMFRDSLSAVALEFLGKLKTDRAKQYASERGGIVFVGPHVPGKAPSTLSFRELLNLLPE